MKKGAMFAMVVVFATVVFVQAADEMRAFPPTEKGLVRYFLYLPEQIDETDFKVELIVGKTVQVDQHNNYFFVGKIESQIIDGWGYARYTVSELGQMGGTLMSVDPNAPKIDRFVALRGEPYLVRYNSLLPVVVDVPEGAEVFYRIWRADAEMRVMNWDGLSQ